MTQKMDFSVTNRQLVLLHRLYSLFLQLVNGEMQSEVGPTDSSTDAEQQADHQRTDDLGDDANLTLGKSHEYLSSILYA